MSTALCMWWDFGQLRQFNYDLLQIKLRLMKERIKSPEDWIVIADSDEFYDFDVLGPGIQVGSQVQHVD